MLLIWIFSLARSTLLRKIAVKNVGVTGTISIINNRTGKKWVSWRQVSHAESFYNDLQTQYLLIDCSFWHYHLRKENYRKTLLWAVNSIDWNLVA